MRSVLAFVLACAAACRSPDELRPKPDPAPSTTTTTQAPPVAPPESVTLTVRDVLGNAGGDAGPHGMVVEAIVASVVTCPPCPPGAKCKRKCFQSYVMLVDFDGVADHQPRSLAVNVPDADAPSYVVGTKVRLRVTFDGKTYAAIERLP